MNGKLFIVATPIGNLKDITERAIETLRAVDSIVCENNRVSSKLLTAYNIKKPLLGLHEHSSDKRMAGLIDQLKSGKKMAYISDAGTPGISDPGGKLVASAFEQGIDVVPIPGASALITAVSACGFPMDHFEFLGFAPTKKGRETFFREIGEREHPSIFYESKHRIEKTLSALASELTPNRAVFVARELTKMHESLYRGTIDQVMEMMKNSSLKGEFVVIVASSKYKI
ncbi:MAG: 16S rRNA (cytidine(1402)-2'-O)-methyltransferase [Patescibacteria group bacterium]|nr:16S rRNA (cytidine(1402)-2'-O)-methyltransferase [Patescibacteria group bacterium]MBU2509178.1 16S rRNA (cytidine(1402)-2'-O)-methyltransferase [Patescibacteria group bacterium]